MRSGLLGRARVRGQGRSVWVTLATTERSRVCEGEIMIQSGHCSVYSLRLLFRRQMDEKKTPKDPCGRSYCGPFQRHRHASTV